MLSVATILILLRVWSTILDGVVLRSPQYQKYFECTTANAALNILAVSVILKLHCALAIVYSYMYNYIIVILLVCLCLEPRS